MKLVKYIFSLKILNEGEYFENSRFFAILQNPCSVSLMPVFKIIQICQGKILTIDGLLKPIIFSMFRQPDLGRSLLQSCISSDSVQITDQKP